jgi:dTDP-4-dehydrorhamnose 3,5-epimerase
MKVRSTARKVARPAPKFLLGAKRDAQSVTRDWQLLRDPIAGVDVREVKNVLKDNGYLTEVWRDDWALQPSAVAQVFQALIEPGGISAWHAHMHVTDRLFANHGRLKIVLYDARTDSASSGRVNVFHCGSARPMLIVVPPGIWHGVHNVGAGPALLLNLPDRAYAYDAPDHWRLPPDTDQIPYSFAKAARPQRGDPGQF